MRQKGFAQIIIIILLLVLVGGGAYYFGTRNPNTAPTSIQTPEQTVHTTEPTTDPTTNWKTFTNTQYHFSFKYPEALILEDRSISGTAQILLIAQDFRETKISASKDDMSEIYLDTSPVGKATIGNLTGNKYYLPQGYCDGPSCSAPILAVSVVNNGIKYVFSVFVQKGDDFFTDLEKQILSTFKFTQ